MVRITPTHEKMAEQKGIGHACKRMAQIAEAGLRHLQLNSGYIINQSDWLKTDVLGKYQAYLDNGFDRIKEITGAYSDLERALKDAKHVEGKDVYHIVNQASKKDFGKWAQSLRDARMAETNYMLAKDGTVEKSRLLDIWDKARRNISKPESLFEELGKVFAKVEGGEALFEAYVKSAKDTVELLTKSGFEATNLLHAYSKSSLLGGDFVKGVFSGTNGKRILPVLSELDTDLAKLNSTDAVRKAAGDKIKSQLDLEGVKYTDSDLERLTKDLMDDPLGGFYGKFSRLITEARGAFKPLKYFWGPTSGSVLALNSGIMNWSLLEQRMKNTGWLTYEKVVDDLLGEHAFLRSESRFGTTDLRINAGEGESLYSKVIDFMIRGDGKASLAVKDVMKSGLHAAMDMFSEARVKRSAVAEALSKLVGSAEDALEFAKELKEGRVPKQVLDRLRADAVISYNEFFTNSNAHVLSRNRFSRGPLMALNCMQGYMTARAATVSRAVWNLADSIGQGKIRTFGEFLNHIDADDELKRLMMSVPVSAKMGYWMDRMSGDEDMTTKDWTDYMTEVNDYLVAIQSNFVSRILLGMPSGYSQLAKYSDETGQEMTFVNGLEFGAFKMMSEAFRQTFREMNVFAPFIQYGEAIRQGRGSDFALSAMGDEFAKLTEGMGRFGLLPGFEAYGLKKLEQNDDIVGTALMALNKTNESMDAAGVLRDADAMEAVLSGKDHMFSFLAAVQNLPVIGKFMSPAGVGFNAPAYKRYEGVKRDNEVVRDLISGIWRPEVVDGMGAKERDAFFYELTKFDYSNLKSKDKDLEEYAKRNPGDLAKDATFLKMLESKLGAENLKMTLAKYAPDPEKVGLAKIVAFAEAKVPGSGRAVLSYVANEATEAALKAKANERGFGNSYGKLDQLTIDETRAEAVKKFWPFMYGADKLSWAASIRSAVEQADPALFKKTEKGEAAFSSDARSVMNTMMLLDTLFVHESRTGSVDAGKIKSVFSLSSKYVSDPADRMEVFNWAMAKIDRLGQDPESKAALKIGAIAANADLIAKMVSDKKFMKDNAGLVKHTADVLFGQTRELNATALTFGMKGLTTPGSSEYSKTASRMANKLYNPYPSSQKSSFSAYPKSGEAEQAWAQASPALGKIRRTLTNDYGYYPSGSRSYAYNPYGSSGIREPSSQWYWKIDPKREDAAKSWALVTGYVPHTLSDAAKDKATRFSWASQKAKRVNVAKIAKEKVRWTQAKFLR